MSDEHPHRVHFVHVPHPHVRARRLQGPVTIDGTTEHLNDRIARRGTQVFGSMPMFYLFVVYGALGAVFVSAQAALLYWSNWVQLWSLPLLMVGGLVIGRAADKRAVQMYHDVEAILSGQEQLQAHLTAQDAVIDHLVERLASLEPSDARDWTQEEYG